MVDPTANPLIPLYPGGLEDVNISCYIVRSLAKQIFSCGKVFVLGALLLSSCTLVDSPQSPLPSAESVPQGSASSSPVNCEDVVAGILSELQIIVDRALDGAGEFQEEFEQLELNAEEDCPPNPDARQELVAGLIEITTGILEEAGVDQGAELSPTEHEIVSILSSIGVTLTATAPPTDSEQPALVSDFPDVVPCSDAHDLYLAEVRQASSDALAGTVDLDDALDSIQIETSTECTFDQAAQDDLLTDVLQLATDLEFYSELAQDIPDSQRQQVLDRLRSHALQLGIQPVPTEAQGS